MAHCFKILEKLIDIPILLVYYLARTLEPCTSALGAEKAKAMFFSIDPNNGVAIYEQIVRQVKFAIAEQTLRPGQLLPSVRTLSQQLAINPNTINRAFQQLQVDGVLESIRGKGLAVCTESLKSCVDARKSLITERFKSVISEALHAGLEPDELRQIVAQQIAELAGRIDTISGQLSSESPLHQ